MTSSAKAREATDRTTGPSEAVEELPWIEDGGKVAPKDARVLSRLFLDRTAGPCVRRPPRRLRR
ncbi:hypothetical protein ACWDR3_43480, partial [Streptomyces sp. NPDC001002]